MALDRIRHAYSVSDYQIVLFSGGKDSSTVLNLVIEVATELGRLPVPVLFIDEEAIPPETVEYVDRVRRRSKSQ
jgi:predicted phosphoadenosine phosphosulfate sulfurtransferase